MKFRNSPFLLALALVVSSPLMSHASACSNSTIEGTYAFTIHGTVFLPGGAPPLLVDGLAKPTFDGNGNITQLDAVAVNGNVAPGWRLSTGTYSVNPDCTGTFTVSNGDRPPINGQFIVAHPGRTARQLVFIRELRPTPEE